MTSERSRRKYMSRHAGTASRARISALVLSPGSAGVTKLLSTWQQPLPRLWSRSHGRMLHRPVTGSWDMKKFFDDESACSMIAVTAA